MISLTGRVAFVTGASRGIGRAIAMRLASCGAVVVAAARGENAEGTVDAIRSAGGQAEAVALDVTDAAAAEAAIAASDRTARPHRHPGEQRRDHARPVDAADEAGRLGGGAGDESDVGLHADPGRAEADDPAAERPHHLHQLGRGAERQRGSGELRGLEGRARSASPRPWRSRSPRATSRSTSSRRA